ncbi:hypothetical protein H4582DRAFT_1234521 [Lactarius indigo]|nr:hypothetical protein H4582DRAFT_1234521 [Lactarius indigo]
MGTYDGHGCTWCVGCVWGSRSMVTIVLQHPLVLARRWGGRDAIAWGLSELGLSFDPYNLSPFPALIFTTGAVINFPAMASLVGKLSTARVRSSGSTRLSPDHTSPQRTS